MLAVNMVRSKKKPTAKLDEVIHKIEEDTKDGVEDLVIDIANDTEQADQNMTNEDASTELDPSDDDDDQDAGI